MIDLTNTMETNAISRLSSSQYILRSVFRQLTFSYKGLYVIKTNQF